MVPFQIPKNQIATYTQNVHHVLTVSMNKELDKDQGDPNPTFVIDSVHALRQIIALQSRSLLWKMRISLTYITTLL